MTTGRINQVTLLSVVMGSKRVTRRMSMTASLPRLLTHIDECFHSPGHELSTKSKKQEVLSYITATLLEPPGSLALSIFHYTADVKAGSLTDREPRFLMPTRFPCRKRALQRRCLMQTMKFNVGLKVFQAASNFKDLQTVLVLMSTYRVNIQTSTIIGDTSIMYIPPLDT